MRRKHSSDKFLSLDGTLVYSIGDLISALKVMTDAKFEELIQRNPAKITNWINENFDESELVNKLKGTMSRNAYLFALQNYKRIRDTEAEITEQAKTEFKPSLIYVLIVLILFVSSIQLLYFANEAPSDSTDAMVSIISGQAIEIDTLYSTINELERELNELKEQNQYLGEIIMENHTLIGPADRMHTSDIRIESDKVTLTVSNPYAAKFTDTDSMVPVLNSGATAIQVSPENEDSINVGDIVSYNYKGTIVIHRIVHIGSDELGWFAYTKGDNNPVRDREKVRFWQIDRILIAIIY